MRGIAVMLNLIGAEPIDEAIPPGIAVHRYHKASRPGRKVGHLTIVAPHLATCDAAVSACSQLPGVLESIE
jgi:5-(carboxyamino)imidazole ribonucleotide synthase